MAHDAAQHVDTRLGSITDREALERALHSCDAVAHLAAVADVNDVHAEPEDAERVNARGTVAVLEAARRAGVKRIVYASTIWVYSDCEGEAVDEDTLLPPPSHLYTSTKLAGELYCKAYQELYGIDLHDPPLRDPLRPSGSRGRGDPGIRQQGASRASR